MERNIILLVLSLTGVVAQLQVHVIPGGIESVNGSNVTMGCTSPLVGRDGVMVCKSMSHLVDGCSPDIDTSISDWASQLVTVRKHRSTSNIPVRYVLLTFSFDTAVSPTGIDLDLFLCPEWKIGAPYITVYADNKSNLVLPGSSLVTLALVISTPNQSSCNSLSTVNIIPTGGNALSGSSFRTWHILVSQFGTSIDWVHVGEVRFLGTETTLMNCSTTVESSSESSTQYHTVTPSNSPTDITTDHNSQGASDATVPIVVAIGLFVVILVLVVLISLYFIRRHLCSRKSVETLSYELKEQEKVPTVETNPVAAINPILAVDNSRYFCRDGTLDSNGSSDGYDVIRQAMVDQTNEAFYDEVAPDEVKAAVSKPAGICNEENDDSALYATIPSQSVRSMSLPIHMRIQQTEAQSNSPAVGEKADQSGRVYSVVQSRKAPRVPKKSLDLEQYLETRAVFNENIYSESITPSDFIHHDREQAGVVEVTRNPLIYAPIYPAPTALPESFELPPELTINNIKEKRTLRTGQFGEVVLASTEGLSLKDIYLSKTDTNLELSITVAVKKLQPQPTSTQQRAFDIEVKFLSRLRHPNVVRVLGLCYHDPAFIMMEYMREGDLSQFLQKYTDIVTMPSTPTQIASSTLVYMASQIASAMKHLSALNFVHRDLATRNCLVGKNFTVKVADLGVDKNIYQSHYFRVQGYILLPIRWMSTECFSGKFSEKSDVWAFGVTMWEMFTLAKNLPYPHLSDDEVIHNALKREYRVFPLRSAACPELVYEIMESCWIIDLKQRTTFKKLHTMLQTS